MFIAFLPNLMLRAPAERNVRVDQYVEPYISLRWSDEPILTAVTMNIRPLRDSAIC